MGTRTLVTVAVFLLATADLARESRTAPLHVDEPRMLNRGFMAGRLYRDFVRTGTASADWLDEAWQPRKPPLGNVIIAAGLWLEGAEPPATPYDYDWLHDERWNAERGQVPVPEVLHAGRRLVPVFAGAAVAAIFLLASGVGGIAGGLVAAALFHWNPTVRNYGVRALADVPMMTFALWALWYLARRVAPAWDGPVRVFVTRVVILGVLVGIATAIKQNGAVMVGVALAAFGVWSIASAGHRLRAVPATVLLALSSYGLYVGVNPLLYSAPVTLSVAQVRAWNLKFQGHWKARPEAALKTTGARAVGVGQVVAGNQFATLPWRWLTGVLALAGVVGLAVQARREGIRSLPATLLVWAVVTVGIVTVWIPLDWDRYYLPVIAVVSVLAGAVGALRPQASRAQRMPR